MAENRDRCIYHEHKFIGSENAARKEQLKIMLEQLMGNLTFSTGAGKTMIGSWKQVKK
jgi:CRISPR/Cas system-associated endonuclease/helicase Cas3